MNFPETFNDVWVLGRKGLCVEERTKWKSYFQVLYKSLNSWLQAVFFPSSFDFFSPQLQVSVSNSVDEGEDWLTRTGRDEKERDQKNQNST